MQKSVISIFLQQPVSAANADYGLGCAYVKNIGYGHYGARLGSLNLMAYDPDHDISVLVMIPLYDFRNDISSFLLCYNSLSNAAYTAREILGYPGKP